MCITSQLDCLKEYAQNLSFARPETIQNITYIAYYLKGVQNSFKSENEIESLITALLESIDTISTLEKAPELLDRLIIIKRSLIDQYLCDLFYEQYGRFLSPERSSQTAAPAAQIACIAEWQKKDSAVEPTSTTTTDDKVLSSQNLIPSHKISTTPPPAIDQHIPHFTSIAPFHATTTAAEAMAPLVSDPPALPTPAIDKAFTFFSRTPEIKNFSFLDNGTTYCIQTIHDTTNYCTVGSHTTLIIQEIDSFKTKSDKNKLHFIIKKTLFGNITTKNLNTLESPPDRWITLTTKAAAEFRK